MSLLKPNYSARGKIIEPLMPKSRLGLRSALHSEQINLESEIVRGNIEFLYKRLDLLEKENELRFKDLSPREN